MRVKGEKPKIKYGINVVHYGMYEVLLRRVPVALPESQQHFQKEVVQGFVIGSSTTLEHPQHSGQ